MLEINDRGLGVCGIFFPSFFSPFPKGDRKAGGSCTEVPKGTTSTIEQIISNNTVQQNCFQMLHVQLSPRELSVWLKIIIAGIKSVQNYSAQFVSCRTPLPYAWSVEWKMSLLFREIMLCKYLEMNVLDQWAAIFFPDDKYVQMSLFLAAAPFEAGAVWGHINPSVSCRGCARMIYHGDSRRVTESWKSLG